MGQSQTSPSATGSAPDTLRREGSHEAIADGVAQASVVNGFNGFEGSQLPVTDASAPDFDIPNDTWDELINRTPDPPSLGDGLGLSGVGDFGADLNGMADFLFTPLQNLSSVPSEEPASLPTFDSVEIYRGFDTNMQIPQPTSPPTVDSAADVLSSALEDLESLTHSQKRCLLEILRIQLLRKDDRDPTDCGSSSSQDGTLEESQQYRQPRKGKSPDRRLVLTKSTPNTMQFIHQNAFSAVLANAEVIGIRQREYVFLDEAVSPFSHAQVSGHDRSQLSVIRPRFANIPEDLRPVDEQLTIGHHPYIVSPRLRESDLPNRTCPNYIPRTWYPSLPFAPAYFPSPQPVLLC